MLTLQGLHFRASLFCKEKQKNKKITWGSNIRTLVQIPSTQIKYSTEVVHASNLWLEGQDDHDTSLAHQCNKIHESQITDYASKNKWRIKEKDISTLTFGLHGYCIDKCTCTHMFTCQQYIHMQMSMYTYTHLQTHTLYTNGHDCAHMHNFRKILVEYDQVLFHLVFFSFTENSLLSKIVDLD